MDSNNIKRISAILLIATTLSTACGGGGSSDNNSAVPPVSTASQVVDTFAIDSASPYAGVLRDCVYAGAATRACSLSTLPFLGQDTPDPSLDDVMDRVLVSHIWMGENLRSALQQLPADMRLLLRSVTAIVIASDIRPAFYDPESGAIYLDADYLWLTPEQQAVVTDEEDFRADFGDVLQFNMPWRYVRDNSRLGIAINPDGTRALADLLPVLGFLLYHELAHAVDFMPPDKMATLTGNLTAEQAITSGSFLSTQWDTFNPLTSSQLKDLAQVSFRGASANAAQRNTTPDELVAEFGNDSAIQYYAYSTQFEDFATMFETVMMQYHFGYEKDTGITTNTELSNDGIVAWGQRGRLGEQGPNTRARAVIQALYPGDLAAVETFLSALGAPVEMTPGISWADNLSLGAQSSSAEAALDKRRFDNILERRGIR